MKETIRWTVRGVSQQTLQKLAIVRKNSDGTFGDYVNEAVAQWYESLPDVDEEEDGDA
jgi:hypothetical protein